MDKLKLNLPERMPLMLDDLYWMEGYLSDSIQAILKAFDTDASHGFVVNGCTVSGTSISAGYIYLNGELIKVYAQTLAVTAGDIYFTISNVEDTNRLFGDANSQPVRINRKGVPQYSTSVVNNSVKIDDTLQKRIAEGLPNGSFQTLALESGYSHGSPTLRIRKNAIGNIEITGIVNGGAGVFAHMPSSDYFPANNCAIPIRSGDAFNVLTVRSDGTLDLASLGSSGPVNHYIHGTIFIS